MPTKTKPAAAKRRRTKTTKPTIHIGLLLDESGSMGGKETEVVEGVNQFINGLRGQKNSDRTAVSVTAFDTTYPKRVIADKVALDEVADLHMSDYNPRGGTPLLDAVANTIGQMGHDMKEGDKALLVIYTDGEENSSREASAEDIRKLVAEKEKQGWEFIYLGANQDAWAEGGSMGVARAGSTFGYTDTSAGRRAAFGTATNAGMAYLSENGSLRSFRSANSAVKEIGEDELTTGGK